MRAKQPPDERTHTQSRSACRQSDRGLSDLVGFTLSFGVIIVSVGLAATFGMSVLEDLKTDEQANSAEESLKSMANNFNELERGVAPRRTSGMNIESGKLFATNDTNITILIDRPGSSRTLRYFNFPHQIVYSPIESGSSRILYDNGAILRGKTTSRDGLIQNDARMQCTDDGAVVSIIRLNVPTKNQLSSGSVRITGVRDSSEMLFPRNLTNDNSTTDTTRVELHIDSQFQKAWVDYLTDQQGWSKIDSKTIECDIASGEYVYVQRTTINTTLSR